MKTFCSFKPLLLSLAMSGGILGCATGGGVYSDANEVQVLGDKWNNTDANKTAGTLTMKVYDSVAGAEKALGIDVDGIDGKSTYTGKVTVVLGNFDGGTPDFAIVLLNSSGVTPGDFYL